MEPHRASFGKYTILANMSEANTMLVQRAAAAGFARLLVVRALITSGNVGEPKPGELLDDAKRAARLHHPNIQQIHEVGVVDGSGYVALEYLEGIRYDELLRARNRAPALADPRLFCALLAQTCEGLHQGHRHRGPGGSADQLVHAALRPQRLFLTSGGTVKLLDFGLNRAFEARTGEELGDPEYYGYMAPEQVLGRTADARSDVFSVGVIAWESLTGRRLFSRASRVEVLRAITQNPIPPPSALEPNIPAELDQVVHRALARNPEERYQTARELGIALEEGVTSVGAPMSTVAIAATVDRHFSSELELQRSIVLKARRELESSGEEDDDFEVPTQLFGGSVEEIDDFKSQPTKPGHRPKRQTLPETPRARSAPGIMSTPPQSTPPITTPQSAGATTPAQSNPPLTPPHSNPPLTPPHSNPPLSNPPSNVPSGAAFARPPETLSDVDDPNRTSSDDPSGTHDVAAPRRTLLLVFVLLILAAAAGTAGYLYWLDLQTPTELSD